MSIKLTNQMSRTMSDVGTKQTSEPPHRMSALAGNADISQAAFQNRIYEHTPWSSPAVTWKAGLEAWVDKVLDLTAYAGGVPMKSRLPTSTPHWRTMS